MKDERQSERLNLDLELEQFFSNISKKVLFTEKNINDEANARIYFEPVNEPIDEEAFKFVASQKKADSHEDEETTSMEEFRIQTIWEQMQHSERPLTNEGSDILDVWGLIAQWSSEGNRDAVELFLEKLTALENPTNSEDGRISQTHRREMSQDKANLRLKSVVDNELSQSKGIELKLADLRKNFAEEI